MDTERWQRLSPLLDELFEMQPAARAERLADLRDEDQELAEELEALIALEVGHADFLAEPIVAPLRGAYPGSEVGPYRLESLLGEGGMGQVWLAARADGLYQRRVALKLLRPGLVDTNLRLRFTRERQILARLAHPHIARLLDAGISRDGLPYLALEYVDGVPITDYCREHGVPISSRLHMFQQICAAVSHAHANLIVHRDLKPSNILVTPAGEVQLLDFGIAKLLDSEAAPEQTRTGVRAFTLHYAAPEQIRGEPVTTMTDVYSLGVVLYELLTGCKPYRLKRNSDAEWEEAILAVDPLRPSLTVLRQEGITGRGSIARHDPGIDPAALRRQSRALAGDLDNIVLKTVSKRPEQRYPSVEALSQDLSRFELGRPVHARAQSVSYRLQKYLRRHRWSLATGLLIAAVLSTALTMVAWQAREAVREAGRAQAMQDFMLGVFENAGVARDGEALDLRQLLDASVERGNQELVRQPHARAELLGVVARLRTGLGDYAQARALLDQQAAIMAEAESAGEIPPSLRLESIALRGRVLRLMGEARQCIDLMQPALDDAEQEQARLPGPVAAFYTQLGRCRRANGERRSARQLFDRSLALRRENGSDAVGEAENLIDIAGLHSDVGDHAVAMRTLQSARAQMHREVGDRHPLLIDIRRNLAALHHEQGDLVAASREAHSALALALEANGPLHPASIAARRQLGEILADQGRYKEAETHQRQMLSLLQERLPARHPELAEAHLALGGTQWERGAVDDALSSLREAVDIRRSGDDQIATGAALMQLGAVLHAAGRDREALPLLIEAREWRRQRYGEGHARVGDADRLLGEVEVALGRVATGTARLETAATATRVGYGPGHPNAWRAELALARQQARDGTGQAGRDAALARLDAIGKIEAADTELRGLTWRARADAAGLRCQGPQRPEALQALQTLGEQIRQARPEGGALVREVARIQVQCGMAVAAEGASRADATQP